MLRIAWFSSIVSDRTLRSTEFSRRVLSEMVSQYEIVLFTGDDDYRVISENRHGFDFEVRHYLEAYPIHYQQPFDLFCYQIEDDPRLDFSVRSSSIWPGVVFAHDSIVNRVVLNRFSHATTGLELNNELCKRFGNNVAPLGDLMVRKLPIEAFSFIYPFVSQEVANAPVIATFASCFGEKKSMPNPSSHFISCDFPLKTEKCDSRQLPSIVDRSDSDLLIGCAIESKLEDCWGGMVELMVNNDDDNIHFNIFTNSDNIAKECYDVTEALGRRGRKSQMSVVQYDCIEGLKSLISGCDVFIGYRFEPRKNIPLKIIYAIEQGIPVIVGSLGAEKDLPFAVAAKVKSGDQANTQIAQKIGLLKDSSRRATMSNAQRDLVLKKNAKKIAIELNKQLETHESFLGNILRQREKQIATAKLNLVRLIEERQKPTRRANFAPDGYIDKAASDFKWCGDGC